MKVKTSEQEESRKQFEAWFSPRKIAMQKMGISTIRIVRLHKKMLEAWQASRAAIEIELPKCRDYTNQDTTRALAEKSAYNSGVYDSADAIRATGLTVKGDR